LDEQLPDGSWVGGFTDDTTALSKGKKYKATARAIYRLADLSLDVTDPMTAKAAELCRKYLAGVLVPLDIQKLPSHNISKEVIIKREICNCLSWFLPDDALVVKFRNEEAAHFSRCCALGRFDFELWLQTDINPGIGNYSYESSVRLLSYGNVISDEQQRLLLDFEWNERTQFGSIKLSDLISPDEPLFIFWQRALERFKSFSLFGEYITDKIAPYLYSICERLVDNDDEIPIFVNKYFGKIGQYSESWNKHQAKKNDLLLRIIRLLDKCE
jgi:hypothetical protein